MSKIQNTVQQAIENLKRVTDNPMASRIYTIDQVIGILQNIDKLSSETDDTEDTEDTNEFYLDSDRLDNLIHLLSDHIEGNVGSMDESDVIDEESLQVSISGTSASIDSISIDTDRISDCAIDDIDSVVYEWAEKYCKK